MADHEYEGPGEESMDAEDQPEGYRTKASQSLKQKGRGFRDPGRAKKEEEISNARYDSLEPASGRSSGPAKSVEGWVLFVTGLHEEAQEEEVAEAFAEHGEVRNVYLNLDRQTGYVKGYALIEYATEEEAREAIKEMHNKPLPTQPIHVTWAFNKGGLRPGGRPRR